MGEKIRSRMMLFVCVLYICTYVYVRMYGVLYVFCGYIFMFIKEVWMVLVFMFMVIFGEGK